MTAFQKKLWIGMGIMALLTPIGLILPKMLGSGQAWGEWGTETVREMLGYVPKGLEKLSRLWRAPLADYGSRGGKTAPVVDYAAYIASGLLGIILAGLVLFLIRRMLLRNSTHER